MKDALQLIASEERFSLLHAGRFESDFAADVREGLTAKFKSLPPRWFYDELGSSLFDTICFLPEYYVMRAEAEVLSTFRREIVRSFGPALRLVELGSGTARKTRMLLELLAPPQPSLEYVPIDVDETILERCGADLLAEYPSLRVTAICSDFSKPSVPLSLLPPWRGRTVVLFLGSTIGNLEPEAAVAMLTDLRSSLSPGDALLLGADLRKSPAILEPAYDDSLGVTAAFNRNVLARINRELGGEFDPRLFRHHAFYEESVGRIEMHLVSERAQSIRIAALDLTIDFAAGESIHTESSYKHDYETLTELAARSGFEIERHWTDARKWFTDVLLVAR
ncbi:MAG TPA: L-histidine N(alpha)-methyltransferase [Thermoanaerobaculia bacterium]